MTFVRFSTPIHSMSLGFAVRTSDLFAVQQGVLDVVVGVFKPLSAAVWSVYVAAFVACGLFFILADAATKRFNRWSPEQMWRSLIQYTSDAFALRAPGLRSVAYLGILCTFLGVVVQSLYTTVLTTMI